MREPIPVVEILGRTDASDGVSRPFKCLDASDNLYYVKSLRQCGSEVLIREWICGRLAQALGLPVADFFLLRVPAELIRGNDEYERELGYGIVFGSRHIPSSVSPTTRTLAKVESRTLSRILLFDWWVRNQDRTLSGVSGNPNFFITLGANVGVGIFDHGMAFDADFNENDFWQTHAMRTYREEYSPARRAEAAQWLDSACERVPEFWLELPDEWLVNDYGESISHLDVKSLGDILSRFRKEEGFWK